jgi:hypothetical protein
MRSGISKFPEAHEVHASSALPPPWRAYTIVEMDSREVVGFSAILQRKGKANFQCIDGFAVFSVALNVP